ncbi:MAG: DHHW family protein [Eubacteriales bacterium]
MRNKVITAVFCILLAIGIGSGLLIPDKYYSESEKRLLQQFPSISFDSFLSGKLASDIEAYLSDQFPARDKWITVKTLAGLICGKRESGNVYFGKDGFLIDKFSGYDTERYKKNTEALRLLSEYMKNNYGISVRVMLVPTAIEIMSDKLPPFAPHASQQDMLEYAKKQGLDIVDVSETLRSHSDEYIYYRTDHHYTSLGAYYCYAAWMSAAGRTPLPLEQFQSEVLCENFRGTTYSKVNYPFAPYDTITAYYRAKNHKVSYNGGAYVTDSIYERKYLGGKDQYAVFLNSNQSETVIDGEGEGRLLIIKDSYANTFAQFVVDGYEETHLIDLRFYRGSVSDYVSEHGITEILVLYNLPGFAADANIYNSIMGSVG